jgi:cell division protein FtsW
MFIISRINYHKLHYLAVPGLIGSYIILITRYIPGLNTLLWRGRGDAMRWFRYPIQWQPSELTKFAVILAFASLITIFGQKKMRSFKQGVVPLMLILASTTALVLFQKHLSGAVIILAIGVVMVFIGGMRISWLAGSGLAALTAGAAVILATPYMTQRINVWFNPFIDPTGDGWQAVQSLLAIGSGGFWGLGLGQSRQKHLFLPEPANDFIFPVIAEELGFVGATLIIIVFAVLIWRGYYIAMRAGDRFGTLLAAGITTQIAVQVILNLGVVTGLFPVTGVSLPFFSYGGTSLLMLMGEVGILLSVSRRMPAPKSN